MNQILKDTIYGKGAKTQVQFLADLGGMNEEETQVFWLIHKGFSDLRIQEETAMSRKAYERVEESVRAKLLLAVFHCINYTMDNLST